MHPTAHKGGGAPGQALQGLSESPLGNPPRLASSRPFEAGLREEMLAWRDYRPL